MYRGADYKYPYFLSNEVLRDGNTGDALQHSEHGDDKNFDERESHSSEMNLVTNAGQSSNIKAAKPALMKGVGTPNKVRFQLPGEAELAADADQLLIGLGPRFTDWWGYEPLPVDADLLPAVIPGYRKPFRLLPYGVKSKLTDDEMTTLRRLGKPLPCHFALGKFGLLFLIWPKLGLIAFFVLFVSQVETGDFKDWLLQLLNYGKDVRLSRLL